MRVLVADDHPLVRDALARLVRQLEAEVEVDEAADLGAVFARAAERAPELLLVDLNMPGMAGIDGVRRLRQRFASTPLVVASGQEDAATIRAVLAAGANGFVPKTDPPALLLQALRLVQAGGVYVPARLIAASDNGAAALTDAGGLTPRQLDVLGALLRGQPNKLIARELGLSEGTVKIHIAAILRALRARNRTEAVLRARELGLGPEG